MSPAMNPIETMMTEHRLIERVLVALEACGRRVESGAEVKPAALLAFARFLKGYADDLHHGKEEKILYARMVEAGFPRESGPIFVMHLEHDKGRALVRKLRELGEKESWSEVERRMISEAAFEFAALLRAHIQKEDRILYPMAEQRLSPEIMDLVADECRAHVASHEVAERDLRELGVTLENEWVLRANAHASAPSTHSCPICGQS